ncbi:potassium channel family protein [Aeropyrum camini]|uniref:Voltage-gated potassium channel n=1 Tax=Aeropyrum camini SY1 = JCM 12091 TaxID=1198449 RepID=U3TDJ7_9CREN|nr:potassium channel family protein [Aeropyrum camini]BAN90095.1 voltage-gated potassium channel [Aeropyrum camini SY1 = JCM 12091]
MARFRRGLTDLGDRVRSIGDVMEHPLVELGVSYAALLSVIVVVVEYTMQLSRDYLIRLYLIDLVLVLILWIDYAYRAYKSGDPRGYLKKTFYEIPTLIPAGLLALIEGHLAGLGFFRLVRLLRLLRILLIISRGSKFLSAVADAAEKIKFYHLFGAVMLTVLYGAFAIYLVEYPDPESSIKSVFDALWWAIVTATTVGYGDVVPATPVGKMIGIAVMLTGISALTLLIGTVSNMFQRIIGGELEERCTPTKLAEMVSSMSEEEFEDLINTLRSLRRLEKRLD